MKRLSLVIAALFSMTLAANAAIDPEEVRTAMINRAAESAGIIEDLREDLATAPPNERGLIIRKIRTEQARARQLVSFARLVNRYRERRLKLIVMKYNLPVSLH